MNKLSRLQALLRDIGTLQDEADKLEKEIAQEARSKTKKGSTNRPKSGKRAKKSTGRHVSVAKVRQVRRAQIKAASIRAKNSKPVSATKMSAAEAKSFKDERFIKRLKDAFMSAMTPELEAKLREALPKLSKDDMYELVKGTLLLTHTYYDSESTQDAIEECGNYDTDQLKDIIGTLCDEAGVPFDPEEY